ncbi:MAG TPA: NADH-quinone oxidoreductase subunit C [Calditrichaeota bacterium]|nr:NADH-quinone oxidoreductase subunit C [Calditrichota bacterium]
MTAQEIHDQIKTKFPEAILEFDDSVLQPFMKIAPNQLYAVCHYLRDEDTLDFDFLSCLSGVDQGETLATVYHLYSMRHKHKIVLKTEVAREKPEIASVADLWRTADWHEREAYDLFGIIYVNHPDLRRILLPDDWEGYPLRKDYVEPDEYNGIQIKHPDMMKGE